MKTCHGCINLVDMDNGNWECALDGGTKGQPHIGCHNEATVSTTSGHWHLCESCAQLPRFNRYKFHSVTVTGTIT